MVGAGTVAAPKVRLLLRAGAVVTVVVPAASEAVRHGAAAAQSDGTEINALRLAI